MLELVVHRRLTVADAYIGVDMVVPPWDAAHEQGDEAFLHALGSRRWQR
jgi:hypothetical protein